MEKVWLATKYYLDDKLAGCSAATERMFTRLLAWVGDNETGGKLPKNPHTFVGLLHGKSAVKDLVSRGVLLPESDGGFRFNGWGNWNAQADELAKRKQTERDRKRRERERRASMSRDMSRDVTLTRVRVRDRDRDGSRDSASHVSSTRDPETPPPDEQPSGPPIQRDAARLVRDLVPADHPATVRTALRLKASELIHSGTDPDDVAEALRRWVTKSGIGPGVLASLVSDVVKERSGTAARAGPGRSTTDERVAQAQALKRRNGHPTPELTLTPRKALE
jgi:hypothetical protein